jgi:hypothetical protein
MRPGWHWTPDRSKANIERMFDNDEAVVYPLFARRPGWTVSEHPSGMLIWRGPDGRHYLSHPARPGQVASQPSQPARV